MSYPTFLTPVERQVRDERERQDAKWGEQNHPDGTGILGDQERAESAKATCQYAASQGCVTWRDILWEEVAEAFAESDPDALTAELVQIATVALNWVESINRRRVRAASVSSTEEATPPPDMGRELLIDPDCRGGKCSSCVGGPCGHGCHQMETAR